jgi:hypothetical protein
MEYTLFRTWRGTVVCIEISEIFGFEAKNMQNACG